MDKLKEWENKIVCGDCLELMKELPDGCVDLVVTDPPYNQKIDYGFYDDQRGDYPAFIKSWFIELERLAKTIIITPSNGAQHLYPRPKWTLAWIIKNGMSRTPLTVGSKMCLCTWEPILWFGKSPSNPPIHDTIFVPISKQVDTGNHPCPKPLGLFKGLIIMGSDENDLILDPFIGSGTTALACKQLGRRFIGFEINPKYVAIANERLRQEILL